MWILISQLVDNIITKITRDDRYYLQDLDRSFKFSFGPQADRLESGLPLKTLVLLAQSNSIITGPTVSSFRVNAWQLSSFRVNSVNRSQLFRQADACHSTTFCEFVLEPEVCEDIRGQWILFKTLSNYFWDTLVLKGFVKNMNYFRGHLTNVSLET